MTDRALVVGGGPAGLACAAWLADAGIATCVIDARDPAAARDVVDVITPRAVAELDRLGVEPAAVSRCTHHGVRLRAHGRHVDVDWAGHDRVPSTSVAMRRSDLVGHLTDRAVLAGAEVRTGVEATEPLLTDGHLRGARTVDGEERADWVVIADGTRSSFGRALGTARDRRVNQALGARTTVTTAPRPGTALERVEVGLDIRGHSGAQLPGFGWIVPLDRTTAGVGVGMLTRTHGEDDASLDDLLHEWVADLSPRWGIPPSTELDVPARRHQLGWSIHPKSGPGWVAIGDAVGAANPLTGDGLHGSFETARLAAHGVVSAVRSGDGSALAAYERGLTARHRDHIALAGLAAVLLRGPRRVGRLTRTLVRHPGLARWVLSLADEGTDPPTGPAARARRLAHGLAALPRPRT